MNQLAKDISAEVVELLHRYGFDLGDHSAHALVDYWLHQYPAPWIRLATIEALYQGRYKAISIEQILNLWRRRSRTLYHFNSEFERMISLRPRLGTPVTSPTSDRGTPSTTPVASSGQNGQTEASPLGAIETADTGTNSGRVDANRIGSSRMEGQSAHYSSNSPYARRGDTEEIRPILSGEPLPIDQFTPTLEVSDFYWRLKAVVRAMGADAEEVGRRN